MSIAARLLVLCVVAAGLGGCFVDHTGNAECTPERHCISDGNGMVECEVGYRWEDESDPDNFTCVPDNPDAGS